MKKVFLTLAILATALAPRLGSAHGMLQAGHGGQIVEVGDLRIEFAVREGGLRAWVRDHDDHAKAATGKVTLLTAKGTTTVPFKAGAEMLAAEAPVITAESITAVLSLVVDGKPVSARFVQMDVVRPVLSAAAATGKQSFESVCAKCHGSALRGTDQGPPLLNAIYAPANHGDDVILAAMKNGAPQHMWQLGNMPKPEGLAPGAEPDVLAYIRAMQAANGIGTSAPAMDMPMGHDHHH
jgi:cytochrome c2